ncbi:TetR/AcrR family transcriptional regulator [Lactococcus garvieae]|uniref:TetR/AcrR family transcriptional regulator n=1 Tax=Lactococcus garvieae TaxID=1363 RepID=UPI0028907651|nr:TetR/AcrR family transcriptional regulator [Lactococcus garvieae]MDT2740965.1 TetR/AcrR family transcriptional regulator [Lactococcus garvieae]
MGNSETADAIINYFIEQLHTKNINQISVMEIAQEVGISRVTFYNYFKSKEDIIETILEEILIGFDQLQKENLPFLDNVDMANPKEIKDILYPNTLGILLFFKDNKKYIEVLLKSTDIVHFMDILHSTYYNHFLIAIPEFLSKKFEEDTLKSYALYMTSGVKTITEEWFFHDFTENPETVANRILDMLAPSLSELYNR